MRKQMSALGEIEARSRGSLACAGRAIQDTVAGDGFSQKVTFMQTPEGQEESLLSDEKRH